MATYNGGKYIREQVASILSQMDAEDELIISDDSSSDDTIEILQSFNDARIKIYRHKHNAAITSHNKNFYWASDNFQNALRHANGDIIFLCDQDDIWHPDKIAVCRSALERVDFIKHNYARIDTGGNIIKRHVYNADAYKSLSLIKSIWRLPFRGCCMAFKKKIIEKSLPFPDRCLQHDSWIGMNGILSRNNKFEFIDEDLIFHRVHDSNVSILASPNSLKYKIKYRLILLLQLIKRCL